MTFKMPGCETKNSITSAGFLDDASKSMSPMISLNRRKLPAALHRITSGCSRKFSSNGSAASKRVAQQMFARVSPPALDAFQNIRLRFLAETVQFRDLAGFAGRLQFLNRIHAELFVQRLDFFRAEPGNFQHLDQARRNGSLQFVVVFQFSGLDQFRDFLFQRLADALDFAEPFFGDEFFQRLVQAFNRPRARWRRRAS